MITKKAHDAFLRDLLRPGSLCSINALNAFGWFVSERVVKSGSIVVEHKNKSFALVHSYEIAHGKPTTLEPVDWKKARVIKIFDVKMLGPASSQSA